MQRFYIPKKLENTEIFEHEKFHQLSRVLRAKVGDEIILFSDNPENQDSGEWIYEIVGFTKKSVELHRKMEIIRENPENIKQITLFQALPNKMEKIEWILQKNIEIGVQKFVFFKSERSQKLFLSDAKKQRFGEIAREALEQCGGIKMPEIIFSEKNLETILKEKNCDIGVFLHTSGENDIQNVKNSQNIGIFVGPEGGWSDAEIEKMYNNGLITAHFGERIFRTETAGMCVAFLLNFL